MKFNLSKYNLNLLVAFDKLIKEQHVTRAAEKLHLTQPALSNSLKQLREIFQDELFIRGKASRMIPTPRALELAKPISEFIEQATQIFNQAISFDPKTAKRTFTIGMSDYAEFVLLPPLIQFIIKEAPQIEIVVKHLNYLTDEKLFEEDKIDLAVGIYTVVPERLVAETLFTDESVCVGNKKNPFLKKPLTLAEFAKIPQLVILYYGEKTELLSEQILKKAGLQRKTVVTAPHTLPALYTISKTNLISMVLKKVAVVASKNFPLTMQPAPFSYPDIKITMVWHPKNRKDPAHQWLRQQIKCTAYLKAEPSRK